MWPFGKSDDKKTHETIERIEKRIDGLIKSEQEARQSAATAQAELAKANAKIAELQSQVRAQNEADLYFASAKIMRDIMLVGKHMPEDRDRQAALLQRVLPGSLGNAAYAASFQNQFPYQQSGLGSIFGGR